MLHRLALTLCLVCVASVNLLAEENTLTDQEKKEGWQLLFDGQTTKGWLDSKEKPVPQSHVQPDGLNPHPTNYMLIYDKPQGDFVLSLEFKLSPKCNSGVFVRTWPLTPRPGRDVGFNGIEIAVDDTKNADLHDTGAIYDLVKPSKNAMKPAGEWNKMVVTCDRNKISVELNGEVVTRMDLDQWPEKNKRPDGSAHKFDVAFKDHPRQGYIGLQDHGSDCWYRNIKLKPLGIAGMFDEIVKQLPKSEKPIHLFNGKDLESWEGAKGYWSVDGDAIKGANKDKVASSTYLFTKEKYRNYRLLFEVKQTRGADYSTMHSAIATLGEKIKDAGDNEHGFKGPLVMFCQDWGIWDAHRRNRVADDAGGRQAEKVGDWNLIEVLVRGERIRCVANGKLSFDFTDKPEMLQASPIGLQLHSNDRPQEYRFRGLVITKDPEDRLVTLKE